MRGTNTITQLKQQVQKKSKGNYCNSHFHKTISFYQLHLDKVVYIQRWFRSHLLRQNNHQETLLILKIRTRDRLNKLNQQLQRNFSARQDERAVLMDIDQNVYLRQLQDQELQKLRKVVNGTLQNAQKLAENNGRAKYALSQITNYKSRSEELQGEIQALRFEFECHKKRKAEWKQKLLQLQKAIINETSKSAQLEKKLGSMEADRLARQPQGPHHNDEIW